MNAGQPPDRVARGAASRSGVTFVLNGEVRHLEAPAHLTLLTILRDQLAVMDPKEGCDEGVCGACTVLLEGRPVSSCLVLFPQVAGKRVLTVRGLGPRGSLHPLQEAFLRHGAAQCGFCTPGMLLTAYALLEKHPGANRDELRRALSGNLCRCTGYVKILDAVEDYGRHQTSTR